MPNSFGEWRHRFPDNLTNADMALVAAYYTQKHSEQNEFKTSEVNKMLQDHGVKLSNASYYVRQLPDNKLAFQVGKSGVVSRYRVSNEGEKRLKDLARS